MSNISYTIDGRMIKNNIENFAETQRSIDVNPSELLTEINARLELLKQIGNRVQVISNDLDEITNVVGIYNTQLKKRQVLLNSWNN
jgi:hypothetical protein